MAGPADTRQKTVTPFLKLSPGKQESMTEENKTNGGSAESQGAKAYTADSIQVLKGLEAALKGEKQENGHVHFVFPPIFQGLDVTVAAFDGIWKLVGVKQSKK